MYKLLGKKLLSLILALALLCTVLPRTALPVSAEESLSGSCGENLTWNLYYDEEYDNGYLYIEGFGDMWDFAPEGAPWYAYRDHIQSVWLSDAVTKIGACTFQDCSLLEYLTVPEEVTVIGNDALSDCTGLLSLELRNPFCTMDCGLSGPPETMTVVGYIGSTAETYAQEYGYGFSSMGYCPFCGVCGAYGDNLTWTFDEEYGYLMIEGSGPMMDFDPWDNCWNDIRERVQYVSLPDGVTSVGAFAFEGFSLVTFICLPPSVEAVGLDAFANCASLYGIQIANPNCQLDCGPFGSGESLLVRGYFGSTAQAYADEYGYSFDPIEIEAQYSGVCGANGDHLTWVLDISSQTLTLEGSGDMADYEPCGAPWYNYHQYIFNIVFPDELTSIGVNAFQNCTCVQQVQIPPSVAEIRYDAFSGCSELWIMRIENPFCVISCGFSGRTDTMWINGFAGSTAEEYAQCYGYCFVPFYRSYFGTCGAEGDNLTWRFLGEDGVLYISGSGDMMDYFLDDSTCGYDYDNNYGDDCWSDIHDLMLYIEFPEGLTSIGENALQACPALTMADLPSSVETVKTGAFADCSELEYFIVRNPLCAMECGLTGLPEKMYVYGYHGSTAESYALTYGYGFSGFGEAQYSGPCGAEGSNLTWSFNEQDGTLTITGSGAMMDYNEPSETGWNAFVRQIVSIQLGEGITGIGANAFNSLGQITTIRLPASVTVVGSGAFNGCNGLTEFYVENPLCLLNCGSSGNMNEMTVFGYYGSTAEAYAKQNTYPFSPLESPGFGVCGADGDNLIWSFDAQTGTLTITGSGDMAGYGNLTPPWYEFAESIASLSLSETMTGIGTSAFRQLKKLQTVTIPGSVNSIGIGAFSGCSGLNSLIISEGVSEIRNNAFSSCYGLTSVTLPASLQTLGANPFKGCKKLEQFDVAAGSSYFSVDENGVLYSLDQSVLVRYPLKRSGRFVIPDSVEAIADYAFEDCDNLTSVVIPESVTGIGSSAFEDCYSLNSAAIPNSVTSIGRSAFASCYNLASASIPNSITAIPERLYYYCSNLRSLAIPDSVTSIGKEAFSGEENLTSLTIPESVVSVGQNAFSGCDSLTSVTIPGSISEMDYGMFSHCDNLTSVTIMEGVTVIGADAFYNCPSLTSVTIPEGVTSIGSWAFRSCTSLSSLSLPESLRSIGSRAFEGCTNLQTLRIPSSVRSLGYSAFSNCTALTSLTISEGVSIIDVWMFDGCSSLRTLTIPHSVTKIRRDAFRGCTRLDSLTILNPNCVFDCGEVGSGFWVTIYGYLNSTAQAYAAEYGYRFTPILNGNCGTEGDNLTWSFNSTTGVLTIAGSGDMADYPVSAPWYPYSARISALSLPDSLTCIGKKAFRGCDLLTSVTIPGNVTAIHGDAFLSCSGLLSLTVLNSNCEILCGESGVPGTMTVYGYANSTAQAYAERFGYAFRPLDSFTDVNPSAYYAVPVAWAYENGITTGTGSSSFSPNKTCTREQAVTFLWRAYGSPEPAATENPFGDVLPGKYYETPVLWAYHHEPQITGGTAAGKFGVGQSCTRAQVVTFLWAAAGKPEPTITACLFTDVQESDYFRKAVLWAVENGITSGTSSSTFSPNASCTRGQIVTFLYRALG